MPEGTEDEGKKLRREKAKTERKTQLDIHRVLIK